MVGKQKCTNTGMWASPASGKCQEPNGSNPKKTVDQGIYLTVWQTEMNTMEPFRAHCSLSRLFLKSFILVTKEGLVIKEMEPRPRMVWGDQHGKTAGAP